MSAPASIRQRVSVVIPTHRPDSVRMSRTLAGLAAQTLPGSQWETLLIDNASSPSIDPEPLADTAPPNLRLVQEPQLGLSAARRRGILESRGNIVVFVDDDNVLKANYLVEVTKIFSTHSEVGAIGGRITPEFEREPEPWVQEFFPLLALRDLGAVEMIAGLDHASGSTPFRYPTCAPIGAGMALRREAALGWAEEADASLMPDRTGRSLSSSGDNDIVLTLLRAGWDVGYFPELVLTHLIPAERLQRDYLARLNRGIQCSWQQVLARHEANPWPSIPGWSLPLRKLKAWFTHRAWSGPAAYVRWLGACGHFEGRVRQ